MQYCEALTTPLNDTLAKKTAHEAPTQFSSALLKPWEVPAPSEVNVHMLEILQRLQMAIVVIAVVTLLSIRLRPEIYRAKAQIYALLCTLLPYVAEIIKEVITKIVVDVIKDTIKDIVKDSRILLVLIVLVFCTAFIVMVVDHLRPGVAAQMWQMLKRILGVQDAFAPRRIEDIIKETIKAIIKETIEPIVKRFFKDIGSLQIVLVICISLDPSNYRVARLEVMH